MSTDSHTVVVNDDEQYSLWPVGRPVPAGWTPTGHVGTEDECLAHIRCVWVDLRPRRVRERLDGAPAR